MTQVIGRRIGVEDNQKTTIPSGDVQNALCFDYRFLVVYTRRVLPINAT